MEETRWKKQDGGNKMEEQDGRNKMEEQNGVNVTMIYLY